MRYRLWQWVHNCVAHPIEGWFLLLLGGCPSWVDRFHEWTAARCYPASLDLEPPLVLTRPVRADDGYTDPYAPLLGDEPPPGGDGADCGGR